MLHAKRRDIFCQGGDKSVRRTDLSTLDDGASSPNWTTLVKPLLLMNIYYLLQYYLTRYIFLLTVSQHSQGFNQIEICLQ